MRDFDTQVSLDTNWPWPLDGVQRWFEDTFNSLNANFAYIASVAVDPVRRWIRDAIRDIIDYAASGLNWVVESIKTKIGDVNIWLVEKAQWLNNSILYHIADLKQVSADSFDWLSTDINRWLSEKAQWLAGAFRTGIDDLGRYASLKFSEVRAWLSEQAATLINYMDFQFKEHWRLANEGLGLLGAGISDLFANLQRYNESRFETVITRSSQDKADILAGVVGALGEGLRSVFNWILEHLRWLAEMIMGAVEAVVSAVGGFFSSIFTGFINLVTGAMMGHSPEPQLARAVDVMSATMWQRQLSIIKEAYKSSPTPETLQDAAIAILGAITGTAITVLIGGAAVDLAHPVKEIMASRTARELMWMIGVPAVTASIITLPTAIGLLTPLRYTLNEMLQPMQPGAADIIRFAVRECFVPERLPALLERYPTEQYTKAMAREGYSSKWAEMFWGAHWVLPSLETLNTYLYRHDDFIDTWRKYVVYHDYIPESVKWLEEVIYPPWTRVDVRRMWEMRTISEADLYREYRWLGYDDYHAKGLVLWTKIYVAFPDLVTRMKNGWITAAQVYNELIALGMPKERANELMETIVKASSGERTSEERTLTKAEIIKGAKANILTPNQAVGLLMDLGYEEWEAWYILAINKVVAAGHPGGYWEMRRVTELYKKSRGQPYQEIPEEIVTLEAQIKKAKGEVERLKKEGATEEAIGAALVALGELEYHMRQLLISHKLK